MKQDFESALQALLDKQSITELVHAYCNAADRGDYDKMRQLYHDDAIDDHGGFFKGLAQDFIDQLPAIQEPMEMLHHNVTTLNIKLHGETGEGEVYVLAFHKIKTEQGSADLLIGGRYFDKYEKRDGEWRFSHRAVVADWWNFHEPTQVDPDNPMIVGSLLGSRPGGDVHRMHFFNP